MLYRWPQGRIIRVIAMILVALVAFDFGRETWGSYKAIFGPTATSVGISTWIIFGVLSTLTVGVAGVGLYLIGFHPKSAQFLIEVEGEMGRVTWPTRSELMRLTVVIAILALILTGIIFAVDLLNRFLKDEFFHWVPRLLGAE